MQCVYITMTFHKFEYNLEKEIYIYCMTLFNLKTLFG